MAEKKCYNVVFSRSVFVSSDGDEKDAEDIAIERMKDEGISTKGMGISVEIMSEKDIETLEKM